MRSGIFFDPLREAARDAPGAIGWRSRDQAFTFAELDAETDKLCLALEASDVRAGDRIAISLPPSIDFYTLLFAALRLGALVCPLNLRLPPMALSLQLSIVGPKLFVSNKRWQSLERRERPLPHGSLLIFTSGSTGAAKLAVLPLAQMMASAASANACCHLRQENGWLLSLPLHHVGGLAILFRCLLARASVVTDPSHTSITHLSYVPAQLYSSWPVYPNLSCLLLGGSPLRHIPKELPIIASYGMTETASLILGQKSPPLCDDMYYLGFPLAGKEIKLSDEGELLVRADSLFCGYWDGEKLSATEEWFATKDLGKFHPDNGFAIIGRKDNLFISGGENIQPEEIERHLLKCPGVIDAIVVPVEDPHFGERPAACLRTVCGAIDQKTIQSILADHLPKYKIPSLFFSLDAFGATGLKSSRKEAREAIKKLTK